MTSNKHPNILYLHCHDAGRWVESYGAPFRSPALADLASEGVQFNQAFCVSPTCSPARASLLTGQYPHQCGMLGLAHLGFRLHDYERHLLHALRRIGYRSALSGIQHIANPPAASEEMIGYDLILAGGHNSEVTTEAAVQFLREQDKEEPFFLSVGYFYPHRPFPEPTEPWNRDVPAPLPDTPDVRKDLAGYEAALKFTDDGVGRILNALEQEGLSEKTLVIATTDHGPAFPGMKCQLSDAGMGVFLILRGPAPFCGGRTVDAMVTQLDIYPTLCDWLGIERPSWLEGKSFLPLLQGELENLHAEIFGEVNFHAAPEAQRVIRSKRWKYIERFCTYPKTVLPNIDDGPTKSLMLRNGLAETELPGEALYDLEKDPLEQQNLATCAEHKTTKMALQDRLHEWMHKSGDPLSIGSLEAPPEALLLPPDAQSPDELIEILAQRNK